jgi:hypothetical protein
MSAMSVSSPLSAPEVAPSHRPVPYGKDADEAAKPLLEHAGVDGPPVSAALADACDVDPPPVLESVPATYGYAVSGCKPPRYCMVYCMPTQMLPPLQPLVTDPMPGTLMPFIQSVSCSLLRLTAVVLYCSAMRLSRAPVMACA